MNARMIGLAVILLALSGQPAAAETARESLKKLIAEIAPEEGRCRPPYLLARYDRELRAEPKASRKELSKLAAERQDILEALWEKAGKLRPTSAREEADLALAQYAFGELDGAKAWKATKKAGFDASFRFARFQLSEFKYDEAVQKLMALSTDSNPSRSKPLDLLRNHYVLRNKVARRHVPMRPLNVDLLSFLGRNLSHPELANTFDEIRQSEQHTDSSQLLIYEEYSTFREERSELKLRSGSDGMMFGWDQTIQLETRFFGKHSLRLYRFTDSESWRKAPARLEDAELVQAMIKDLRSVRDNNREEAVKFDIDFHNLPEGLYMVVCEPQLSPYLVYYPFILSKTALHMHVAENRVVVVAVDRVSGNPVTDLDLALMINGTPDRGNRETHVVHKELHANTGNDGCAVVDVSLHRKRHEYSVAATAQGKVFAQASTTYRVKEADKAKLRSLIWTAQPIYRPGDTVNFMGIVRTFDGRSLSMLDPAADYTVEVRSLHSKRLWVKTLKASPAGAIRGKFRIPNDADLGGYRFLVDNEITGCRDVTFTVREFRKPAFNVQVDISPNKEHLRAGELCSATVHAEYADGRPVASAKVELSYKLKHLREAYSLVTEEHGSAFTELPPIPNQAIEGYSTVKALVVDASGISYSGKDSIQVQTRDLRVDVSVNSPIAGGEAHINFQARTIDGRPVHGAVVTSASLGQSTQTDNEGRATIALDAKAAGTFSRTFTIIEDGNAVKKSVSYTIRAKDEKENLLKLHFPSSVQTGGALDVDVELDLAADRDIPLYIACENTSLRAHKLVVLKERTQRVTFPVSPEFAPYVHVSAVAFVGKNEVMETSEGCHVNPVHQFLSLEIVTDKDQYRPGERCEVTVTVRDWQGHPVPDAEVSLGVVDRAIYWLREDETPDLGPYFHEFQLPRLPIQQYDWSGRLHANYLALGPYLWPAMSSSRRVRCVSGCARGAGVHLPFLRADFRPLAFWTSKLLTGRNGEATATFKFPDSIGNCRFTARAITAEHLTGEVLANRKTALPFDISTTLPRAMRKGDRIVFAPLIHNSESALNLRLQHQAGSDQNAEFLTIPENGSVPIAVPVSAFQSGQLPITILATNPLTGQTDAIRKNLAVAPRGHYKSWSTSRVTNRDAWVEVLPSNIKPPKNGCTLTFRLESGSQDVIENALQNLIAYPYGCVEQTMSRFMPAIVAARAMDEAKLSFRKSEKLPAILAAGVKRLLDFQHSDGAWGWWKNDESNVYMTAYVLEGLSLCRSTQVIPSERLIKAERWLQRKMVDNEISGRTPSHLGRTDRRLAVTHSLACYYSTTTLEANPERVEALSLHVSSIMEQAKEQRELIIIADIYRLIGKAGQATDILKTVMRGWTPPADRRTYVYTAAPLLELGTALDPNNPRWSEIAGEIIAKRNGNGWGDTLITATAVRGFTHLLPGTTAKGTINLFAKRKLLKQITKPGSYVFEKFRGTTLRVQPVGCSAVWSVEVEAFLAEPLPNPRKPDALLGLSVYQSKPGSNTRHAISKNKRVIAEKGKTIEIELVCNLRKPIEYTRLTFRRPCGIEFLSTPEIGNGISGVEERDDAYHIYIRRWGAGKHTVKLSARAEVTGRVFAPIPELKPMYDIPLRVAVNAPTRWVLKSPREDAFPE